MAGFGCSPRDDPEGGETDRRNIAGNAAPPGTTCHNGARHTGQYDQRHTGRIWVFTEGETQGRGPLADGDRRGWGYGGSGPAQLALVILLTDASAAERFHQRSGASSRRSRRIAGCWTPAPSSAGSSRRGRTTSCAWRWRRVEHAPAAGGASAGGVSGASGDGGGGVPGLSDAVRHRRAAAAAGDVSGRAASPGLIPRRESILDPEDGTMTLRFIVGRILRELTADRSPHRRAGSARASARTGTSAC